MNILYTANTGAHEITVYETNALYGERGRFRVMQFSDGAVQGAIDLNDPTRILFEYPRAIIHLIAYNNTDFDNVFIIGHGIGTIAGHYTDKRSKTAELDETVVELSRCYFGYNGDNVIVGDGRAILEGEADDVYDYIVVDAFTDRGVPQHLCTQAFFDIAAGKLIQGGTIIMNLFGRGMNDPLVSAIHTTLGRQFTYTKSFSLPRQGAADIQNIILTGSQRPIEYQARRMAGFTEIEPGQGHVLMDEYK